MNVNSSNLTLGDAIEDNSPSISDVAVTIVYVVIGLLGFFGNALVLLVIVLVRDLHDVANILIGNQSLIDLVTSLLLLASYVAPLPPLPGNPTLSRFLCAFWNSKFPFWSLIVASSLNLTLMTLERYYAIVFPMRYHSRTRSAKLNCLVTLPWLSGFAYQQYLAWFTKVEDGQCLVFLFPSVAMSYGLTFGGTFLELLLPLVVMVYVYIAISLKLKASMEQGLSQDNGQTVRSQAKKPTAENMPTRFVYNRNRARRNVIKMMLMVSACFIICWLPNQLLYWAYCFGLNLDLTGLVYTMSVCIAFGNMWVNPFIYSFQYRRFQRGLRKVFCRRAKDTKPQTLTVSNTVTTTI